MIQFAPRSHRGFSPVSKLAPTAGTVSTVFLKALYFSTLSKPLKRLEIRWQRSITGLKPGVNESTQANNPDEELITDKSGMQDKGAICSG